MCTADLGEYVQVWAHVSTSVRPDDTTFADRAVVWLVDPPDSPMNSSDSRVSTEDTLARMISHGVAQVSLGGEFYSMEETHRMWLPSDFRVLPHPERKLHMSSESTIFANSTSASSVEETNEYRQVVLSTILVEALRLNLCSIRTVRLLVRRLQCVGVAAVLELRGPISFSVSSESDQNAFSSGFVSNLGEGQLPASVVDAVSSILPSVLEGEVVSRGSVLSVVGMFKVVVDAVRVNGNERSPEGEGGTKLCDAVVRIDNTTKLSLLRPRMSSVQECSPAIMQDGEECRKATSHIQFTKLHSADKLDNKSKEHAWGQGTEGSNSCFTGLPASGPALFPGAMSVIRDVDEWLRLVQRDFGGEQAQVLAAVRVAREALEADVLRGNTESWSDAPPGGLLLHGATGTGKTLLARSVAKHSGAPWFFLDCSSVFRKNRGEAEQHLQELLEEADACSPSVVVLDQLDSVCRKRPEVAGIAELQVFSILSEAMDHCRSPSGPRVFFVATCTDATALDSSFLQRGRLEVVLRLGSLETSSRASILEIHARDMPLRLASQADAGLLVPPSGQARRGSGEPCPPEARDCRGGDVGVVGPQAQPYAADSVNDTVAAKTVTMTRAPPHLPRDRAEFLRTVAGRCHGYLGSDLERLCREAAMRRMSSASAISISSDFANNERKDTERELDVHPGGESKSEPVELEDFWAALDAVRPASLVSYSLGAAGGDSGSLDMPTLPLVGCDSAIAELRSFVLVPLANPSLLRKLGLGVAGGALLHGPPGCGKTSVARALAAESRGVANFIEVRCSDLVDKVVGRSERSVSELFAAARAVAPCILFLDQVEGVAARRGYHSSTEQTFDRILSTLLVEMDGVMSGSGGHVVVLAATNDISRLDPAILRPGRLDRQVYLGLPDLHSRKAILAQRLSSMPLGSGSSDLELDFTSGDGGTGHCTSTHASSRGGEPPGSSGEGVLGSTEDCAVWLANRTEGFSGAQVVGVCREAALAALREDIRARVVAPRHFNTVLRSLRRERSIIED